MKQRLWPEYFELLMDFEGRYYEDDPDDPGGETKFGIDKRSHPDINIKLLTEEQAERVYWYEFEESFSFSLPEPLAELVFDFVINAGEGAAAKAMQRAVGVGVIDGIVGTKTRYEIMQRCGDGQEALIDQFTDKRISFYERLVVQKPRMQKFLKGWKTRANRMKFWAMKRL